MSDKLERLYEGEEQDIEVESDIVDVAEEISDALGYTD